MRKIVRVSLVLCLLGTALLGAGCGGEVAPAPIASPSPPIVLKTGDQGVHYEGIGVPEMVAWGPESIVAAPDGTFVVADTAGGRIVRFDHDGEIKATIDISSEVKGATDIALAGGDIVVLDTSALVPAIVRFHADGSVAERFTIPPTLAAGSSGVLTDSNGSVFLEREGGAYLYEVAPTDGRPAFSEVNGLTFQGHLYSALPADMHGDPHTGELKIDGRTTSVTSTVDLTGATLLRVGKTGIYLLVEETQLTPVVTVDQTVRHYDVEGKLIDLARVPIADRLFPVSNGVTVDDNGAAYALIPLRDRAEIRQLQFQPSLRSSFSLGPSDGSSQVASAFTISVSGCISRQTMSANANEYVNAWNYVGAVNLSGGCSGRSAPRYLGAPGWYPSVSYNWDGNDFPWKFGSRLAAGAKAGNWSFNYLTSCATGTDCSGFVGTVWAQAPKYSTVTLQNISSPLDAGSSCALMKFGDIFDLVGSHVRLFDSSASGGMYVYESTVQDSVDRVVHVYRKYSDMVGYVARRFSNVCPGLTCVG